HAVWCREVIPVVGTNLLSVAGEWAGWERRWVIERARRCQGRRWVWPYPGVRRIASPCWNTIAGCMERRSQAPDPAVRLQQQEALSALAEHLVDFLPKPLNEASVPVREATRRLGLEEAWALLCPCLLREERTVGRERLERAFAQLG